MNISVRDLTRILKGQLVLGDPKAEVSRATVDSRNVKPGDGFFALKGQNEDGHNFCLIASRQGAGAVVVSRLDWLKSSTQFAGAVIRVDDTLSALQTLGRHVRQGFKGKVVGITGSNGKTTTKNMLSGILRLMEPGLSTQGNFNSQIGLPLVLSELKPEDKWMVLELGASAPGHISQLADIALPHIGVITSIGPAHLATFGSLAKVGQSKWELIQSLPTDGCAVVPWGEPALEPLIRGYSRKIMFFGEDSACVVRASSVEVGEKIKFQMHVAEKSVSISLPIGGRFNVRNALAAACAAWVMGIPTDVIAHGLNEFNPPPMRMELLNHYSGALLVNDAYNANPASMMNSILSFVESFPEKKKIVVLGSMLELGEESEKLHFHVGTELGRCPLEKVFLYGDETESVKEGALAAGASSRTFIRILNLDEIKHNLVPLLSADTAVLFKGSRAMNLDRVVGSLFHDKPMGKI